MRDFITMAAASSALAVVVIGSVYFRFGKGLASRIFGAVIPLCVIVVLIGYYIGSAGVGTNTIVPAFAVGVFIVVPWLLFMYRLVVARLEAQISMLASSTAQIAATAKQSAATAAQQAATVAEISATIEELQRTSAATAAAAKEVSATASEASKRGYESIEAAGRAKSVLALVARVTDVVDSIRDFADQSNMLAVNAGIEAAKAGEHGRGFSVVAAEVRNLAEQSKLAAQRIRTTISNTEGGKHAIDEVDAALARLAATLEESTERTDQIAATAAQEAAGVLQIAQAMTNVTEGGQANAAAARQLEDAIRGMNHVSEDLRRFVTG